VRYCIVTRKQGRPQYYTVYNSNGTVALITSCPLLAQRYTREHS